MISSFVLVFLPNANNFETEVLKLFHLQRFFHNNFISKIHNTVFGKDFFGLEKKNLEEVVSTCSCILRMSPSRWFSKSQNLW